MSIKYQEEPIKVPRFEESSGFYTTEDRSRLMSKIKRKNTKPEIILRKSLYELGFRYRIDFKGLPGRPDISNKSKKIAIFIDGEFWHGYNWEEKKKSIKSNREFWIPKIERNMQRDRENNRQLKEMDYHVLRFWEHEIKKHLDICVEEVFQYLRSG
ncbi:MAG: very short patch repair endonuclease [Balneola sp.]|nr:MAG: very short patch repair endonuclease [Balneola sp.]